MALGACGGNERAHQDAGAADEHRDDRRQHADEEELDPSRRPALKFWRPGGKQDERRDDYLQKIIGKDDDEWGAERGTDHRSQKKRRDNRQRGVPPAQDRAAQIGSELHDSMNRHQRGRRQQVRHRREHQHATAQAERPGDETA